MDATNICDRLRREVVWEPEIGELLQFAANVIEALRLEVRTQRQEIAALRAERQAVMADERPRDRNEAADGGWLT